MAESEGTASPAPRGAPGEATRGGKGSADGTLVLSVRGLRKAYGARQILDGVSLDVGPGELLALLGCSGSGKSTLLNLIAGLDRPDAGEITIEGVKAWGGGTCVPPHRRRLGFAFQDQLLWPHLTATEHLDFVLRGRGAPRAERRCCAAELLTAVHLANRAQAYPAQLSGGERQRLSLGRALAGQPALLLLDEPCNNLDAPLRHEWLALLDRLRSQRRLAVLYVTHDVREVLGRAARVAVLDGGRIVQSGAYNELRRAPACESVTRCLGPGEDGPCTAL